MRPVAGSGAGEGSGAGRGGTVPSEVDLDREFAFVPWRGSCRDPHLAPDGDLRQCRRRAGHDGPHASGYAPHRERWEDVPEGGR